MGTYRERLYDFFESFAHEVAIKVGSPWAFTLAVGTIAVWGMSGPAFGFSDTWQLVINTGTTIVTFLIVFLIQHSQNKDAHAIQLKLNELIAAVGGASNLLIDIEEMSDDDLDRLQARFRKLAEHARREGYMALAHRIPKSWRTFPVSLRVQDHCRRASRVK